MLQEIGGINQAIGAEAAQEPAVDPGQQTSDQPHKTTHFNDHDQRGIRLEPNGAPVRHGMLTHGAAPFSEEHQRGIWLGSPHSIGKPSPH
jgi:hypothetical protein